jgi:DNA-binding CsgD family transcriptional regulator
MAAMRGMDMNGLVPRKGNGSVAGAPERPNETCPQVGHDSMAGLVLLDSHKRPVYANGEAIRALAYPEEAGKMKPSAHVLAEKVCSLMPDGQDSAFSAKEFISGRRRYLCRVFQLESGHRNGGAPAVAILMERTRCVSFLLSATIEHFRLTAREEEAVKLLLEGLTSKEIAGRMHISPNTVKAFLRLVMIKMGVSTRSGIAGKILQA